MNSPIPPTAEVVEHRVEFYRLPRSGQRDPFFGLSRGWYYKAADAGEIRMIALRQRNSLRGVRLIVYDSVLAYIERASSNPARAPGSCDG